jgi:ribonuclease HI
VDPATPGFYSTFFLVAKKDGGGQRPVLNLKGLKQIVQVKTFKMMTIQVVLQHLQKGDWLASLDLKDAYFHVPVQPVYRPYLRFELLGKVYQFKFLPFGLFNRPKGLHQNIGSNHGSTASKRDSHLSLSRRLPCGSNVQRSIRDLRVTQEVLMDAGFLINLKKSYLTPTQKLKFLGLELDTNLATAVLPENRALDLARCCQTFMRVGQYQSVKTFLRLLGLMAATWLAVPHARLHMRPIQWFLNSHRDARIHGLSHKIMISRSILPTLQWWAQVSNLRKGLTWKSPKPSVMLTTDASLEAWGAHMGEHKVQGRWAQVQRSWHINLLEMLAVFKALKAFQIKDMSVLVQTDNTTVISYINKSGGTRSPQLCQITWEMFSWCMQQKVSLQSVHIPGVSNLLADKLSRQMYSPTEWELNNQVVQKLFLVWGMPEIDLFATQDNKKLPQFCSLFPHQQALHQDTLALQWDGMFAYAFPSIAILNRVLHKIVKEKVTVILIAPMWTCREWYPLLLDFMVAIPYRLPAMRNLVTQDRGSLIHHNPAELCLTAWLLSTNRSLREDFLQTLQTPALRTKVPIHTEHTSPAGTIFSAWCQSNNLDPGETSVTSIVEYLQYNLDQGKAFPTVKGRVSAISYFHPGHAFRSSLGSHELVWTFIAGARRLCAHTSDKIPMWDLPTVLQGLMVHPFEPLQDLSIEYLTIKTVFLVAICSARRIGELQALDCRPPYCQLGWLGLSYEPILVFSQKFHRWPILRRKLSLLLMA